MAKNSKTSTASVKKVAAPKKMAKKASAKKPAAKKATPAKKVASLKKTKVSVAPTKAAAASVKKRGKKSAYKLDDSLSLALAVAQGMYEKKASGIRILDMRHIPAASAEFFVISHAASDKQVEAIAESAEDIAFEFMKQWPWHREGYENCDWVLLDYVHVVAHVFKEELRSFYGLEELWSDSVEVEFVGK